MAKVNKIAGLTENEKKQQRLIIPFDMGKMFVTNLNVIFETDDFFSKWEIKAPATTLKGNSLKMEFMLKVTAVEKMIEDLDPNQLKIPEFLDPDKEED